MTQIFQRGAKRYANVLGVLLALAVVSSILLHSGCGLTGSPKIPTPTPTPTPTPDMRPPTVTSFSPAAGAKNVGIDTNITITFSEAMDARTINFSTIDYRDPSGGNRGGSLTYNPATFTAILQPFDLPEGTTYTVRVRGGAAEPLVKDLAGNALVADVTWTFTTAIYPKVSVTTPSDGATDVSTGVAPIAYFNKPLDPKSVNDQSVALTDASNAPVPFNIFYDEGAFNRQDRAGGAATAQSEVHGDFLWPHPRASHHWYGWTGNLPRISPFHSPPRLQHRQSRLSRSLLRQILR